MKNFTAAIMVFCFTFPAWGADKKLIEKGKIAFQTNCQTCHGEKGAGDGPAAVALNPKPRNFATEKFKNGETKEKIFETITKGLPGTLMVAYGHLPEAERKALAEYVVFLRKSGKKK